MSTSLKLSVITTCLLLSGTALAAESDKAGHSNPPGAPGFDKQVPTPKADPNVKTYPPVMGKDLDNLRTKLEKGVPLPTGKDAPLAPGQTLAPGQADVQAVKAPPPTPLPHGPPQGATLAHLGAVPKGWAECSQTHMANACEQLAKTNGLPEGAKWIIKLPESGKVDELNAFLDDMAARAAEGMPK